MTTNYEKYFGSPEAAAKSLAFDAWNRPFCIWIANHPEQDRGKELEIEWL